MANDLWIYRRFYCIAHDSSVTGDTYNLIDPTSLSADVYNVSQGNTLVESSVTITQVSTGEYYASLTRPLYVTDDIYEVNWKVTYNSLSPIKNLYSKFKMPEGLLVGNIIEVGFPSSVQGSNGLLEVEVLNNGPVEYEIVVPTQS